MFGINLFQVRSREERLDFEPQTITQRVHDALGIQAAVPTSEEDKQKKDRVIAQMMEHTADFFSNIKSGAYKSDEIFQELDREVKQASSLNELLNSVINTCQRYYDSIFLRTDPLVRFFQGADYDSNGGFLNSIRLQASLFYISADKLMKRLSKTQTIALEQIKKVLNRIHKSNTEFIESLSSMHIGVLKKLYNILGENFKQVNHQLYKFKSQNFDFDSSTNPTRLLPVKNLTDRLVQEVKKHPYFIQQKKKHDIDLETPAFGCPAFFVRDDSGKSLPNIVSDWFQEIIDDYAYPEFARIFKLKQAPLI